MPYLILIVNLNCISFQFRRGSDFLIIRQWKSTELSLNTNLSSALVQSIIYLYFFPSFWFNFHAYKVLLLFFSVQHVPDELKRQLCHLPYGAAPLRRLAFIVEKHNRSVQRHFSLFAEFMESEPSDYVNTYYKIRKK